jgi:hypothetical protein
MAGSVSVISSDLRKRAWPAAEANAEALVSLSTCATKLKIKDKLHGDGSN